MPVVVTNTEDMARASLGLPPAVHAWIPYRYHFNTFDFGAGTPYVVESVKNLLGWDATSRDVQSDTGPGSIPGLSTLAPKTVEFTIKVDREKGTDVEEHIAKLKAAFTIPPRNLNVWVGDYASRGYFTDRSTWFYYFRPGWTEPRVLYARVTKFDLSSSYELSSGFIEANIQMVAPDPISYGYFTKVIQIPSGDEYELEYEGDYPDGYAPRVVLHGAVTNPRMERTYTNFYNPLGRTQTVRFAVSRTGMEIDFKNRVVQPVGVGLTITDDEFWSVLKGTQTLSYTGGSGSRADYYIREAWL